MAFFNEFPHTRTYDNDLGWIIKTVKALEENLQNFIKLNTVKYADPIQWDISNQYESNTVVIDALTGVAYISTQPVPTGVNINNKDYWTPVFTLDLVNLNKNITLRNDGDNHNATFESVVGDWVIVGGQLYRVTRDIEVHTAYVVGFNIEIYTVELFVKDYLNQLLVMIGDLQDLDTEDKTSVVNAINSIVTTIGDLQELDTEDKNSVVNAINSIVTTIGDLQELDTKDKTSLVNAINENTNNIVQLKNVATSFLLFPTFNPVNNPAGHCMIITHGNHAFIVDVGRGDQFTVLKNQLAAYGIDTIDGIFITHYHGDHDGNGAWNQWSTYFDMSNCVFYLPPDVPTIIDPTTYETGSETEIRNTFPNNVIKKPPYDSISFYDFTFETCNNTTADYDYYISQNVTDYNQYSQMIRISKNGVSVLNLADCGQTALARNYFNGNLKSSTIITAGHHGGDGVSHPGLAEALKPQYIYASDCYRLNSENMRDPFVLNAIYNGTTFIDNVVNYPDTVSGNFNNFETLSGRIQKLTGYNDANYKYIYVNESADADSYQNGSSYFPFSSWRRALTACTAKENVIVLLSDMTYGVVINGNHGNVTIEGGNHNANFSFSDNAHAVVKYCKFASYMDIEKNSNVTFQKSELNGGGNFSNSVVFIDSSCSVGAAIGTGNIIAMNKGTLISGDSTIPVG